MADPEDKNEENNDSSNEEVLPELDVEVPDFDLVTGADEREVEKKIVQSDKE